MHLSFQKNLLIQQENKTNKKDIKNWLETVKMINKLYTHAHKFHAFI